MKLCLKEKDNIQANWHFEKMTFFKIWKIHVGTKEISINPDNDRTDPHNYEYGSNDRLLLLLSPKCQRGW